MSAYKDTSQHHTFMFPGDKRETIVQQRGPEINAIRKNLDRLAELQKKLFSMLEELNKQESK